MLFTLARKPDEPTASNPVTIVFEPSPPSGQKPPKAGESTVRAPEIGPVAQPPPSPTPPAIQASPSLPVPPTPPAPPVPDPPMPAPPIPVPPPVAEAAPKPVPRPPPQRAAPVPRAAPPGSELSAPMNFSFGGPPSPSRLRPSGRPNSTDTTIGATAANNPGPPPTDTGRSDPSMKMTGARVGSDWYAMLRQWWQQHSSYPEEAARLGQDGTVRLHMVVDRYGNVSDLQLVGRSGSQWLDMGAQSVFRGAKLPPFPPSTPESQGDLDLIIHYYLVVR